MKRLFLLFEFVLLSGFCFAQNINLGTETFSYRGLTVNHYGVGWYPDPTTVANGPMAYFSAYGGLRFFTRGLSRATFNVDGNFGLGTDSPAAKLHILNSYSGSPTAMKMFYEGSWGTVDYANNFRFIDISSTEGGNVLQVNGYGIGVGFSPPEINSPDKLYVNGNVGIGTRTPKGYKLAIAGSAIAESVTVKLAGNWPDYVFEDNYKLTPLSDIKIFIDRNHHLPEVPSAQQIALNGVNLGDMNTVLVKKVEELTLYLIDKDKHDLKQQSQISALQSQVDVLKAQLGKLLAVYGEK